jgi:hypothetical protein
MAFFEHVFRIYEDAKPLPEELGRGSSTNSLYNFLFMDKASV